ncbi:MAG: hypothetical protein ACKVT0_21290 [Planctomycetaceae bacterium]
MMDVAQHTSDDPFEKGSESNHRALETLSDVLKEIGFSVRKKTRSESTLRVYPKRLNQYPLLNPRFVRSAQSNYYLEVTVLSKDDDHKLDDILATFENTPDCTFISLSESTQGYRYHGRFVVPLNYLGNAGTVEPSFSELSRPLTEIHRFLVMAMQSPRPGTVRSIAD